MFYGLKKDISNEIFLFVYPIKGHEYLKPPNITNYKKI